MNLEQPANKEQNGESQPSKRSVRFGAFELDLDTGELRKHGLRLKLQRKPFQILQALLESPGEIVTREELKRCLWQSDTSVDFESGLNTAANRLRITLGDSAESPRYIETLARTGYRFIAPVTEITGAPAEHAAPPAEFQEFTPAPAPASRWSVWAVACAVAAVLAALATYRIAQPTPSSFRQITFRPGRVSGARFAPDGQSILYSANWGGGESLYLTSTLSPESRVLDFKDRSLAGVSRTGELALLSRVSHREWSLARVPLNGGSPLAVAGPVSGADWGVEPNTFAIYRNLPRESVVEYPIGKVLFRTPGAISWLRVSPSGDAVAFLDHPVAEDDGGQVRMVERTGESRVLSAGWGSASGLAWSPSGREVFFSASRAGTQRALHAVTRTGKLRQVAQAPGGLVLYDISRTGQVLVATEQTRMIMQGSLMGEGPERDLSWFDWTNAMDISRDGRLLLFDETGEGGGPNNSVYVRDGSSENAVRIGNGAALALSPDGKWALGLNPQKPDQLNLWPIGGGAARTVAGGGLIYQWAKFLPDGRRLVVGGNLPGHPNQLFVQSLDGGKPRPVADLYFHYGIVSADGSEIAGKADDGIVIVTLSTGQARTIATPLPAIPILWSDDGKSMLVRPSDEKTVKLFRLDLERGSWTSWKDLVPPDKTGLLGIHSVVVSQDTKSYAYSYFRSLSELFVASGWL